MNKFDLFRKLYKYHAKGNAWLDTVPNEINEAFFDNPYVGALRRQLDLVQAAVFTEEQLSDIDWFLFDWSVTPTLTWKIDDVEYSFSGIDEYIQFLQEHRSEVWDEESQAESTQYWMDGRQHKLHRTDGPAMLRADGTREWWLNGVEYSFSYWCKLTNKTEEEIAKLKDSLSFAKLKEQYSQE